MSSFFKRIFSATIFLGTVPVRKYRKSETNSTYVKFNKIKYIVVLRIRIWFKDFSNSDPDTQLVRGSSGAFQQWQQA